MVFVTFSSLFSFKGIDTGGFFDFPNTDKVVHFVFYFVMVITGTYAVMEYSGTKIKIKNVCLGVLVFSILYGIIIEVLQYSITENRQGDVFDVLANSLGAIVGLLLTRLLFYRVWPLK